MLGMWSVVAAIVMSLIGLSLVMVPLFRHNSEAVISSAAPSVRMKTTPHLKRTLYTNNRSVPQCAVSDAGGSVALNGSRNRDSMTTDGETWYEVGSFTTQRNEVTITCNATHETRLRIGDWTPGRQLIVASVVVGTVGLLTVVVSATLLWIRRSRHGHA